MFKTSVLERLILLGGLTQLAIALAGLAIPHVLGWRDELRAVRPLTRNVFWTYAGYIVGIHLWFAAVSLVAAGALAAGGALATFISGFIAVYWGVRIILQFTWYDRSVAGERTLFRVAEVLLVTAFVSLTAIYGTVAVHGMLQ